jgi:hypothetical protein
MVGRRGEEEAVERLRKPEDGTVADGVGPDGGAERKPGTWTLPASCAEGAGTPGEGLPVERRVAQGMGNTVKVS